MSASEAKMRIAGGSDSLRLLTQIRGVLFGMRQAVREVTNEIKAQAEATRQVDAATREAAAKAREANKAARDAAKEAARSAREKAQAEAEAAREAERALKEQERAQKKAAREAIKNLKEQEREAARLGATLISVGRHALQAGEQINRMSGVKTFGEQKSSADDVEEMLVRARTSIGPTMTREKWKSIGAQTSVSEAAKASGIHQKDILAGLIQSQNEESNAEELLANGGALMTAQARFAQATGGKFGDTAVGLAKYGRIFGLTAEEKQKLPGDLLAQQMQGSLEASTATKFIKQASQFQMVTGKSGREGMLQMLAGANVVKDTLGLLGEQGAATTSTYMGSFLGDLSKGKSVTGVDTSATAILKKFGVNLKDKEGHVDFLSVGEKLAGLHAKVGDAKFGEIMTMSFRNANSRKFALALVQNAEKAGKTDKGLRALANPDSGAGQAMMEDTLSSLGDTAKGKAGIADIEETDKFLANKKGTDDMLSSWRKNVGGFMAEHPGLSAGWDAGKGILGGIAAYVMGKNGGGLARGAWNGLRGMASGLAGSIGVGTVGLAAGATMLPGDTNFAKTGTAEEIAQIKAALAQSQGEVDTAKKGGVGAWFQKNIGRVDPKESEAAVTRLTKELQEALSKMQPPVINITISPDVQARVIAETAHPTGAKARGAGSPQPAPGRQ